MAQCQILGFSRTDHVGKDLLHYLRPATRDRFHTQQSPPAENCQPLVTEQMQWLENQTPAHRHVVALCWLLR